MSKTNYLQAVISDLQRTAGPYRCAKTGREQMQQPRAQQRYSITSSARASSVGGTGEAKRLRGLEVDDQLELGRLNHRKVGRFLTFEDTARIDANLAIGVAQMGSVARWPPGCSKLAPIVDRGKAMACRQCDNLIAPPEEVGIGADNERASSLVNKRAKAAAMSCCLLRHNNELLADGLRRGLHFVQVIPGFPDSLRVREIASNRLSAPAVGHFGVRVAIFDRNILALDEPCFVQAFRKALTRFSKGASDVLRRKPTTGIAGCCARAATGHVVAAPPSSVMNSRRRMWSITLPAVVGRRLQAGTYRHRKVQEKSGPNRARHAEDPDDV